MTSASKRKGNNFEREIVNYARECGFSSERAYASNGRSLGYHDEVDLLIGKKRIQAKIRKTLPAYLQVTEHVDAVIFRQDRKPALVLITLEEYLCLLHQ